MHLLLVTRDSQGAFAADPQCVAEYYAQEWKLEWGCEDTIGFNKEVRSIRALREVHVEEASERANGLDLRAENVRKARLSFPSRTAIGLDQQSFKEIALGAKQQVQSLSQSAPFWKRPGFWQAPDASAALDGALFNNS